MSTPEPGWYPDPTDPHAYRWWNGVRWTNESISVPSDDMTDDSPAVTTAPVPDAPMVPVPPTQPESAIPVTPTVVPVPPIREGTDQASIDNQYADVLDSVNSESREYGNTQSYDYSSRRKEQSRLGSREDVILTSIATAKKDSERPEYLLGFHENRYPKERSHTSRVLLFAVIGILGLSAVAFAAIFLLSGRGPQPEVAMPAETYGYIKVDLNPPASQKINLIRFLSNNLPKDSEIKINENADDPLADFFATNDVLKDSDVKWSDLSSWVGDRIAVAALPGTGGEPVPALFVLVKDENAMKNFFATKAPKAQYQMVRDGYVVIAQDKSTVDSVVAAKATLAEDPYYISDMNRLGTGYILSGWVDLSKIDTASLSKAANEFSIPQQDSTNASGHMMFGTTVEPDMLEMKWVTSNVTVNGQPIPVGSADADLETLPFDTIAAVSFTNLGEYLQTMLVSEPELKDSIESNTGISMEYILGPLSSTLTGFVVKNPDDPTKPLPGIRVMETRKANLASWERLITATEMTDTVHAKNITDSDGKVYVYITPIDSPTTTMNVVDATPTLASNPLYQKVIAGQGGYVGYANLTEVWAYAKSQDPSAEVPDKLTALGIVTAVDTQTPSVTTTTIRLAFSN